MRDGFLDWSCDGSETIHRLDRRCGNVELEVMLQPHKLDGDARFPGFHHVTSLGSTHWMGVAGPEYMCKSWTLLTIVNGEAQ